MKNILSIAFSLLMVLSLSAQEKRASPLLKESTEINGTKISWQYGQPSKKGREIFGKLVPYGKIWRTGANEASVISFSNDVMIEGKKLAAGKYALFTIPGEESWTIIFNTIWNQWGAYNYENDKDALRVEVKPSTAEESEKFTMTLSEDGVMTLHWDKTAAAFKIETAN